jgi:pSer/pThr/pTyr-binding forkhead associated (FHA) protein
MVYV